MASAVAFFFFWQRRGTGSSKPQQKDILPSLPPSEDWHHSLPYLFPCSARGAYTAHTKPSCHAMLCNVMSKSRKTKQTQQHLPSHSGFSRVFASAGVSYLCRVLRYTLERTGTTT
ncbi:hypothetical protein LY78DRAFT_167229 [Colletotrichum sublineola]|nr:hypothetical protein LY78DRAFT_167229 [Colletotrichum sublineola]